MSMIEEAEERRQQALAALDQRRRERNELEAQRADLVAALEGGDVQDRAGLEGQIVGIDAALLRLNEAETPARFELAQIDTRLRALRTEAGNVRLAVKGTEGMLAQGSFDYAIRRAEFALEMAKLEKRQQVDGLLAAYARLSFLEGEPAARSLAAKHGRYLP